MIKTLQKRFVVTAMAAISLLLIVLLGIINVVNAWYLDRESDRLLEILSIIEPDSPRKLPPAPKREPKRFEFAPQPHDERSRMSALYFKVEESGEEYSVDLNRSPSMTEETALTLVSRVKKSQTASGSISGYKYKQTATDEKNIYIFLDTSRERSAILRIAVLSLLTGFLTWLLMLLLVILLSKRAIRPIAENMEKQKQFVTDAGHEIKTPLAIILANTEAMELRSGESNWSRNIKAQVSRLDGLMRDLLTLAKSEETFTKLPLCEIDISKTLRTCSEMFVEPASLSEITINCDFENNIKLKTNEESITRIISTLLDNAVKYSMSQSEITIGLSQTEKATRITVRNECETLPDCSTEKLFDRFYRGDGARTQKNGGYGIGLSSARATAKLLGGELYAKYDGKAIIFTLKI